MIPSTLEEAQPLVQDFPGLDDYGTYNRAPEPMRRITAEDYSARLLRWQVIAIESRQPTVLGYSPLRIHWLNTKNGVGMSRAWRPVGSEDGGWTVEHWVIGCPHDHLVAIKPDHYFFLSSIAPLVHARKCTDCGYEFTYDSSG